MAEHYSEQQEQKKIQVQQLKHMKNMLGLFRNAIAAAKRMGFERGTSEYIEVVSLILSQDGVHPDIIRGFEEVLDKQ
jgi:hypothetical protein